MNTLLHIEGHLKRIEGISYENKNGGAYAFVQFLAYNRELMALLQPVKKLERQMEALEGISWLFNECLAASFTHRQKVIFDNKLSDARSIFETIRQYLKQEEEVRHLPKRAMHRQAA